jgi:uncharacterized protein YlbG (UPF0298 family)
MTPVKSRYYFSVLYKSSNEVQAEIEKMEELHYHADTISEKRVTKHMIEELKAAKLIKEAKGK